MLPSGGSRLLDVSQALASLRRSRPIFHSEADFQHALAWEIHRQRPDASIRLEYRVPEINDRMYVDIWVTERSSTTAVELKHFTRRLNTVVAGERFQLKDQAAQDLGRYDFLKDVQRLEQISGAGLADRGYALALTNDSAYWKRPRRPDTIDADFRLHEGRRVTGRQRWSPRASAGTTRTREAPISLAGEYDLKWQEYSAVGSGSYEQFRYLMVMVAP